MRREIVRETVYPAAVHTYALSRANFAIAGPSGVGWAGGGRRGFMSAIPSSDRPATSPALARTELPKPSGELSALLSMIGTIMLPSDEPEATMDIASARCCLK